MKKSFFILIFFCLALEARPPAAEIKPDWKGFEIDQLSSQPVSFEAVKRAFELEGIVNQDYVIAQIRLETGILTSDFCLKDNNVCGMKFAKIRKTTAIGENKYGYAIYNNWYDCVRDIRLWQQYYLSKGRDLSNYPAFLASVGYASDPFYLAKVEQLRKK